MKLKFLGTSAGEGYPGRWCECPNCDYARKRGGRNIRFNSSAILNDEILLDMNTSTFDNSIRYGMSLSKVSGALITHPHKDHLYLLHLIWRAGHDVQGKSIEELMAMGSAPRFTPISFLDVYGNGYTEEHFQAYPYDLSKLSMAFHRIEAGVAFNHKNYNIMPIQATHVKPGFSTVYIIEHMGKTLFYCTDSGEFDESMREILKKYQYDLIIMEGTGGLASCGDGHMCLEKNVFWRNFFIEHRCILESTPFVLTHMSPHWTPPYDKYVDIARSKGMIVAYDGYEIEV